MSVRIKEHDDGRTLEVAVTGKLEKADYDKFLPLFEDYQRTFGKIGVIFVMEHFDGFDMWALWEDTKFEWKHHDDIARLAMVGDSDWKEWMANFCKPFLKTEIRDYSLSELGIARAWVREQCQVEGV